MIPNDLRGKAVIVTGGTSGIGLATGLAFAKLGAAAYLTYRWGSHDEDALRARFAAEGAAEPSFVEADVANDEDTAALLERVGERHGSVEVLVSNVSFAHVSKDVGDLTRKALEQSLRYSAWPFVGYLQAIRARFGRWPRYAIGVSSTGPSMFLKGYDFVAASKAVMETLCRYATADLLAEDIRINVIRANPVETPSLEATFGPEFVPFLRRWYGDEYIVSADEVARAAVALASGLMDGVKGQVLLVDHGVGFDDSTPRLFTQRGQLGLESRSR